MPKILDTFRLSWPGLGREMRELRMRTGLSQRGLGETLDCSWMTVHRWEMDQRPILYSNLRTLCNLAGQDIRKVLPTTQTETEGVKAMEMLIEQTLRQIALEQAVRLGQLEIPGQTTEEIVNQAKEFYKFLATEPEKAKNEASQGQRSI